MIYKKISKCRICGNKKLVKVLDLGTQALTGVFPKKNEKVESGPLELVKCDGSIKEGNCGLLQLGHNYDMELLYGDNYGYRSSLNKSMIEHLDGIVKNIEKRIKLFSGDLVIDIASNDGTMLKSYSNKKLKLVGIDPTAKKFKEYYASHTSYIADFFSADIVKKKLKMKAKVITSIAMFYDLENPLDFARQVVEILDDEGIWVLEQSYMPKMIENVSYDTVCHEHLEYYALKQIQWLAENVGLKIVDIEFNDTNGASFCVTLAKSGSDFAASSKVNKIIKQESTKGFDKLLVFRDFERKVKKHRVELLKFLAGLKSKGKKVFGYGASTKGNVILQYCGLTSDDIPFISEVNEYKFGRVTPGTMIPIISEKESKKLAPDYYFVLPWHFKDNIVKKEQAYLKSGGHLIFPLPKIKVV